MSRPDPTLQTVRTIVVTKVETAPDVADAIARVIKDEAERLALAGYEVDPGSITIARETVLSSRWLNVMMQAARA